MKFCPIDGRVMSLDTGKGKVSFVCECGKVILGAPEDTLISTVHISYESNLEKIS